MKRKDKSLLEIERFIKSKLNTNSELITKEALNNGINVDINSLKYLIEINSKFPKLTLEIICTLLFSILTITLSLSLFLFDVGKQNNELDRTITEFTNSIMLDHFSEVIEINKELRESDSKNPKPYSAEEIADSFNQAVNKSGKMFTGYRDRTLKMNSVFMLIIVTFIVCMFILIIYLIYGFTKKKDKKNTFLSYLIY